MPWLLLFAPCSKVIVSADGQTVTLVALVDGVNAIPNTNKLGQTYGPQMMDNLTAVVGNDGVTRLLITEAMRRSVVRNR